MTHSITRRSFTVAEYHRMAETGILTPEDRVELIEGEITQMSPIGGRHVNCVNRLTRLLSRLPEEACILSVQNPVVIDDQSEPQPDIALLRRRRDSSGDNLPRVADVLLVIEVADTSARTDREIKIPLYARGGIPEALLVDLLADRAEVYAMLASGQYQAMSVLHRGDLFESQAVPGLTLAVESILGPRPV